MQNLYKAELIHKDYPRSGFKLSVPELTLPEGSITGVVGENGNGKTTLLGVIAGEISAAGSFHYFERPIDPSSDWSIIKNDIAFIPQRIPKWFGTLIQNLRLKAALEGIPADQIDDELDTILDFLDLQKYRELHWHEISTGFRLRFELARVLIGKPKLLVLDEPIANLDINTQQKFLSDLKNILQDKEYPTAVVLSSQQLHEIETVADQMVFLKKGKAVFSGNVEMLSAEDEKHFYEIQVKRDARLEEILNGLGFEFDKQGEYYHVRTERGVDASKMLTLLISKGISLKYFRDISNSTKRLFKN